MAGFISKFLDYCAGLSEYCMFDFPIPPMRLIKSNMTINLGKGFIPVACLALMARYHHFHPQAMLYLALHGSYALMWVFKDYTFGDAWFKKKQSLGSFLIVASFLALYYVSVFKACSTPSTLTPAKAALATALFGWGVFFHFGSDCQKFYTLRAQEKHQLITDGFFSYTRNPNYFGEFLTYAAFNIVSGSRLSWLACSIVWFMVMIPRMHRKGRSMSRYPEYEEWRARTWVVFPNVFTALSDYFNGRPAKIVKDSPKICACSSTEKSS